MLSILFHFHGLLFARATLSFYGYIDQRNGPYSEGIFVVIVVDECFGDLAHTNAHAPEKHVAGSMARPITIAFHFEPRRIGSVSINVSDFTIVCVVALVLQKMGRPEVRFVCRLAAVTFEEPNLVGLIFHRHGIES